jgi:AcrR family transcriptional regulator
VGYRHSKDEMLEGAISLVFEAGLSRLTYGSLARRLRISDRIVVYYFPSKDELIGEVLAAIGARLQSTLGPALASPVADHVEFVRSVWPLLARDETGPVFAVFFEASGLAAAGIEPYRTMAAGLVDGWMAWAEQSIEGDAEHRRVEAAAAIAMLDGLLLVRQLAGARAGNLAARGIVGERRG